jgi:hypothetical protein
LLYLVSIVLFHQYFLLDYLIGHNLEYFLLRSCLNLICR